MRRAERDPSTEVIEPVHWGARLVRTDDVHYTEVAGVPVLVHGFDGHVQPLPPVWAALWARLDGRPVATALEIDPSTIDATDARNILEATRRLKADGALRDVDPSEPPRPRDDLAAPKGSDAPTNVVVAGSVSVTGKVVTLRVDPQATGTVAMGLTYRPEDTRVTVRRRFRTRMVDRIEIVTSADHPADAVGALAALVRALHDREVLATPGLVDLLAGVAERAHVPASPRR